MMLLADEGVDKQIVERLRQDGHEVLYVAEMEPGITDEIVLQRANERDALLITEDKDFGELVYRLRLVNQGVVLLRIMGLASSTKASLVSQALAEHGAEMSKAFMVISPGVLRIRKLEP
jgi:predicted nuclease of predicted toxin-antitoxin system